MSKNKEYLQLIRNSDDLNDLTLFKNKLKFENYKETSSLTQIEIEVLNIAKEILKLKQYSAKFEIDSLYEIRKCPILEKLYSKSVSKLSLLNGYSKEEIFQAIQNLIKKNWIISNQRRTKEEIFNNEKYAIILNFIWNNPGIHASDKKIENEIKLTRNPFLKYILTLENFGFIRSIRIGKKLHFFPINYPESFEKLYILLSSSITRKILAEILKRNKISIIELSRELNIFPNAIQYHLKRLREQDLIINEIGEFRKQKFRINLPILDNYYRITKNHEVGQLLNSHKA